jgi:transposase
MGADSGALSRRAHPGQPPRPYTRADESGLGGRVLDSEHRRAMALLATVLSLVQLSFDFYMLEARPENLIGDRAYDSDGLDDDLKQDCINMIAPHRSTRKLKTQDGRHLRRYERRWLVERFLAWLQWKRRLLIRWKYDTANFLGFVQLACITMLLKQF